MYPEKMSSLPEALFKNLMASIEVGLTKYLFNSLCSMRLRVKLIDHFTVVAYLPGLRMEARLPVTLF